MLPTGEQRNGIVGAIKPTDHPGVADHAPPLAPHLAASAHLEPTSHVLDSVPNID
ncbi:hypothetical protein QRF08_09250 [Mycobacterium tuberculosis]|uniref:hypothetical protein n=1 Tax=Mycobacterium tuberculosis TaxID=1773 RepID=UPI00255C48FE|nr:hypothetical protein [Mycobacterium tuberculosis]WIY19430.1 hypothetical protein QRF08_09250 [Mycobacterium tuberculosis]